jgi:hypothetical protein
MLPCPSMLYYNLVVRPPGPSFREWMHTFGGMAFASLYIGAFLSGYTGAIGAAAGGCTSIVVRLRQFPYRFFVAIPTALFVGGLAFALVMLAISLGYPIGFFGAPIAPLDVAFVAAGGAIAGGWPEYRAFRRRRHARGC